VIKLNQDSVVDILPQKGTYVSLIDPEHAAETKFLRECVEKEVIKQACLSFPKEENFKLQANLALQELCITERNYVRWFELDEDMHGTIFAGCKKAHIWSVIQLMNIPTTVYGC
jgi:GntR family transcriptional regulator, rspAB operon transcriptional repressor